MSPSESVSNRTAINEHIGDWFDQATAPGISVAVVSSSEQLYIDSFGSRDRESNAPVTPETVFGVGSCTKSLTALAVLKLVETGTISLEDPVTKYLPDLEAIVDEGITIHDLLSHGSGMPSDGYLYSLLTQLTDRGSAQHTVNLANKADFHNHIAKFADNRVTDDEWRFYYNTGYTLLGELIEACTRRSYSEYVKEEI